MLEAQRKNWIQLEKMYNKTIDELTQELENVRGPS